MAHQKSPSFCFIAPTSYLPLVGNKSNTHLTLAHLVDKDPTYRDFYAEKGRDPSQFIMMDNSAYELKEPYSPSKLIDLAKASGADAIVLPDYPFQPAARTIEAAEQFIPAFKKEGFKTFFVPQSERGDLEDWIRAYKWAADNPNVDIIGMSILGIPNALPHIPPSYARVVMTSLLVDRGVFNYAKHHHYLGLNAGPALEIPPLLEMRALTTIDSSNPVWMAILGHEYTHSADSFLSVRKVNMPVDFSAKLTRDKDTLSRIDVNVAMTNLLFTPEDGSTKVWYAQE